MGIMYDFHKASSESAPCGRGKQKMKRCKNCQRQFKPRNIRHLYCDSCRGIRGVRFYHAQKGEAIKVGMKTSSLRKRSNIFRKEVLYGVEEVGKF